MRCCRLPVAANDVSFVLQNDMRTNIEHSGRGFKAYKGNISSAEIKGLLSRKEKGRRFVPPPEREIWDVSA